MSGSSPGAITPIIAEVNKTMGWLQRELTRTGVATLGPTSLGVTVSDIDERTRIRFRLCFDVLPGWVNGTDAPRYRQHNQAPHARNVAATQAAHNSWLARLARALEKTGAQLGECHFTQHEGESGAPPWFSSELLLELRRPDPLWVLLKADKP